MGTSGQLLICRVDELRPHPSYVRHQLRIPAAKLSALAEQGEEAFLEPLVITRHRLVIDGYARLELARLQGRVMLPCIEYELTEEEALRRLLQRLRRPNGSNDFSRILLALDLEPSLTIKARSNLRAGGQNKGSSKLTEAERMDVRKEIARIAGVSVGNVTKVKQLTTTAHSDIIEALRDKEVSIHRAWLWNKLSPEEQREKLWLNRSKRSIAQTVRHLLSCHLPKSSPPIAKLGDLIKVVSAIQSGKLGPIKVVSINVPGKAVFVTQELIRALEAQEGLAFTCATNTQ
jgi:hypothetical protein